MSETLHVENLSKTYPTRSGPLTILDGVTMLHQSGDAVAITGPSGSGKSTLLHILGGLDRPTGGEVTLGGVNPATMDDTHLAQYRNQKIGFIFQDHHLLPHCTALENVIMPTLVTPGRDAKSVLARAEKLLHQIGLGGRLHHRPAELSGGERQRVAVARALVNGPALVLADEPTGNLDRTTARTVGELLLSLREIAPTIVVVVTHSQELAAIFPNHYEMDQGRLVAAKGAA